MKIKIFGAGGTIDKIYFDQLSEYEVGPPAATWVLEEGNATFEYEIESLVKKDSLDLSENDLQLIYDRVANEACERIIITHGTDGMVATARMLQKIPNKVVVCTGALNPALFRGTDAVFNIGVAVGAVQTLSAGAYIVMNGQIFSPSNVRKNQKLNRFEEI